jgi:hypothetical protein
VVELNRGEDAVDVAKTLRELAAKGETRKT